MNNKVAPSVQSISPPMVQANGLVQAHSVCHGFFGREGGVSVGLYDALNCALGSYDAAEAVTENRLRVQCALGADRLVTLAQVHSPMVHRITTVSEAKTVAGVEGDALVCSVPGVAIGILTADCAPVLFADNQAGVIAAAHAGWKGAFGGVVEATIEAMMTMGARRDRIVAAIGPCIAQASYEVDDAFRARFMHADSAWSRFFTDAVRAGHWQFDLKAYVADRAEEAGIRQVEVLPQDTYLLEAQYYSYRRTTHKGEPDYGRQLSVIALQ